VKSPVGARDLRPVWSFISFIFSYLLLFIWPLPCPPCPARQKDRRTLPCPLSGRPALPLPCKTDRTVGAWVGHIIRCVILKMRSVGLLPLGDESLVSKRSWEASCMSAALKKRDLLFGERFSPFILIHRQNRFCHWKCWRSSDYVNFLNLVFRIPFFQIPFFESDCLGRIPFSESDCPGLFCRRIKTRNCHVRQTDACTKWIYK